MNERVELRKRTKNPRQKKRYIASLDGLRALAVIAVIAYHLNLPFAQGGLLGVTVFFVLSGYLITGLLTEEYRTTRRINLPQFWLRRVRRLFPAIVLVIVVVAALCVLFNHALLTKMRPDIIPSLFWFQNWWYIFRGLSYFDALGDPSPLTHFWSLAIEEQFYVIWPLILLLLFKVGANSKVVRRICLALALASAAWMAVLFDPNVDPTRVYYGTDTRAFSLLIGAWLSFVWPGYALSEESTRGVSPEFIRIMDGVGTAALLGVVIMMVLVSGFSEFMYRGGILLCSILTALVIAVLVHPRSALARFASLPPFVWIGKRSYGMYLWHYPIILLLNPLNNVDGGYAWWIIIVAVALIFLVSELSYRFVENPIRHGAIGSFIEKTRASGFNLGQYLRVSVLAPALSGVLVLGIAVIGCLTVPDSYVVPKNAINSTGVAADQAMNVASEDGKVEFVQTGSLLPDIQTWLNKRGEVLAKQHEQEEALQRERKLRDPVLIGDSVPGDTKPQFDARFPRGLLDAYIGRRFSQAINVYKGYEGQGVIKDVVVFANFSNFELEESELEEMYAVVGPSKQIFLVTTEMDETFEEAVNNALVAFADKHENVHIIDWHAAVQEHMDEWLWDDKTHLRPEGAEAYEQLIYDSVNPYLAGEFLSAS